MRTSLVFDPSDLHPGKPDRIEPRRKTGTSSPGAYQGLHGTGRGIGIYVPADMVIDDYDGRVHIN